MAGCERADNPAPPHPTTSAARIRTIASVVPAATDILLQMGAADHLVGVSNYEPKIPELAQYPRVGDYHVLDWEQISQIRPKVLAIPRPKQEMAAVFQQRAESLGIDLLDIHMDRLDEIDPVITHLGKAIGAPEKASELTAKMRRQLADVQTQAAGKPPVRTLIALNHSAQFVVGPKNYLDDILTLAGGINVAGTGQKDYPEIDREALLKLDPDAIILFLPEAPPQVIEAAKTYFTNLPQLKSVRNNRLYVHTEWYLMLPTARVGTVAQLIVNDLHPLTATPPTTTTVTE